MGMILNSMMNVLLHDSLIIVIPITIVRISKTSEGDLVNLSFITLICAQTASNLISISFSAMFILNAQVDISLPKTLNKILSFSTLDNFSPGARI